MPLVMMLDRMQPGHGLRFAPFKSRIHIVVSILSRAYHDNPTNDFHNYTKPIALNQDLDVAILELASLNESLGLADPDSLDLVGNLETVELASKSSNLIGIDLALDSLDVAKDGIDIGRCGLASGEVVGVLDGSLEHTLVLLDSVLGSLLSLLGRLSVGLSLLLGLLSGLLLGFLGSLSFLLSLLLGSLTFETLLVLGGVGFLSESLDTLIAS